MTKQSTFAEKNQKTEARKLKKGYDNFLKPTLISLLAGLIYAVSIKYFIMPSGVIMTGSEGIAISTAYYFESNWLFILLYSIFQFLLLAFSFFKVGKIFSLKTFITLSAVITLLIFLPSVKVASPEPENERIVLVLFGAIISGLGKALSLINRGSTGDEDIISVYFSEKLRKPVGKISIIAGSVSMIYGLVLNYLKYSDITVTANTFIYTVIFIFVGAATVNTIYKRYRFSNLTINTDNPWAVSQIINEILPERTFTKTVGIGGYLKKRRTMINLIVTQEELPIIINEINQIEGNNFLYHYEIDGIKGRFTFDAIK